MIFLIFGKHRLCSERTATWRSIVGFAFGNLERCRRIGVATGMAFIGDIRGIAHSRAARLWLIHYPPHPEPEENEFGFAPHTDINFPIFLAQSALPGLEVHGRGRMDPAPAVPGT